MSKKLTCWQCNGDAPEDQYNLQFGRWDDWEQLGYFCSRECLAAYVVAEWDDL